MITIILGCSFIVGIAGIASGKYQPKLEINMYTYTSLMEIFSTSIISLLIMSSIFFLALTRNLDFPYLPSKFYVEKLVTIKASLNFLKTPGVLSWDNKRSLNSILEIKDRIDSILRDIIEINKKVYPKSQIDPVLQEIQKDIININMALIKVHSNPMDWERFFYEKYDEGQLEPKERKIRNAIGNIMTARWG